MIDCISITFFATKQSVAIFPKLYLNFSALDSSFFDDLAIFFINFFLFKKIKCCQHQSMDINRSEYSNCLE